MKKILIALAVLAATICTAAPYYHHHMPHMVHVVHRGPPPRPAPIPHHRHHHNDSWCVKSGRNFWPGFTGGLVGSLLTSTIVQPPSPPPVVLINPVWVPPVYGTRPIYDTYGRIIRYEQYVITPGYWK